MALHGEFKVNGVSIGYWSARRTVTEPEPDQFVEYEAHVGMQDGREWDSRVVHKMEDGAVVLAAKVLASAALTPELSTWEPPIRTNHG